MGVPYAEVIGDPVAHSKSPLIHRRLLEELNLPGRYVATRVRRSELSAYLDARLQDGDWLGCNVTMPLKQDVLPLLDWVAEEAAETGAVNLVLRGPAGLGGMNTDVFALRDTIRSDAETSALNGQPVVLVGAGGAARAVLQVLKQIGGIEVALINRSRDKAAALLAEFGLAGEVRPLDAALPATELLINASSLGMSGQPDLLLDLEPVRGTVVELVYAPLETALVRSARELGLAVVDGLDILIAQAGYSFQSLFDPLFEPSHADVELRELLTS
ncbi:MAG: shikimate dehydrogenase [Sphingomonadales bacterium]|nr:shikimate dehydrogenase [Sphingomonadales bacterium]